MWKLSVLLLHLAVVTVSVWEVSCHKDDGPAMMESWKSIAKECAGECGIDEDFKVHIKGGDMDPCFKRCVMKKIGLLDDKGKYNIDVLHETVAAYTDNKDEAKKLLDKLDRCFDAKGDNLGDDEDSELKRVDILFACLKELKE